MAYERVGPCRTTVRVMTRVSPKWVCAHEINLSAGRQSGVHRLTPTEPCGALAASPPHRSGPRLLHDVLSNSCDAPWSSVSCAEAHGHRPRPVILSRRGRLERADERRHVPAVLRVHLGVRPGQAVLARWSWNPFIMRSPVDVPARTRGTEGLESLGSI